MNIVPREKMKSSNSILISIIILSLSIGTFILGYLLQSVSPKEFFITLGIWVFITPFIGYSLYRTLNKKSAK